MTIIIKRLPESQWTAYRDIRLEALKNAPIAFGSSYEEEQDREEGIWRSRIKDALFALDENDEPIGLLAFLISTRIKTKHKAEIFSVYVKPGNRGKGAGKKLFQEALRLIKLNSEVKKVSLVVNPLQQSAVRLYESFGFKKVASLNKEICVNGIYYDEDLMELFF